MKKKIIIILIAIVMLAAQGLFAQGLHAPFDGWNSNPEIFDYDASIKAHFFTDRSIPDLIDEVSWRLESKGFGTIIVIGGPDGQTEIITAFKNMPDGDSIMVQIWFMDQGDGDMVANIRVQWASEEISLNDISFLTKAILVFIRQAG